MPKHYEGECDGEEEKEEEEDEGGEGESEVRYKHKEVSEEKINEIICELVKRYGRDYELISSVIGNLTVKEVKERYETHRRRERRENMKENRRKKEKNQCLKQNGKANIIRRIYHPMSSGLEMFPEYFCSVYLKKAEDGGIGMRRGMRGEREGEETAYEIDDSIFCTDFVV